MPDFKDIAKWFEEFEMRLIQSLKRNLGRHESEEKAQDMEWSMWQAEKLKGINKFRRECTAIMNDYKDVIDEGTQQLLKKEFEQSASTDQPQFFGVDRTKLNRLIDDTVNLEKHAETAALRTVDDVYRQTIVRAQLALSSGTVTINQAVDIAVKDFLDKGINCIVYRDGRRVNIADYARMALRSASTRASLQGKSERFKALGYDTIQVSKYSMCSDTCLPWQGRVYINDVYTMWDGEVRDHGGIMWGKSNYCGKWFMLLSAAIEKGLFHPNCRHTILLWRDGDPLPESIDNEENERRYKLEQEQRRLENKVRKAKRKVEGLSDPDNIKKAKAELREAQKQLREFIDKVNADEGETILKRDYGKEKIYQNENLQNGLTYTGTEGIINIRSSGKVPITDGNGHYCELIGKIDYNDKEAVAQSLREFEEKYKNSDIEHCRVITVNGDVYESHGDRYTVNTEMLGDLTRGSINEHNHVTGESQYSFSWEDLKSCADDGTKIAIAYDEKYRYSMTFPDETIPKDDLYDAYNNAKNQVGDIRSYDRFYNKLTISDEDVQHEIIKRACEMVGIKYGRQRKKQYFI
ncbi:MAG TPA: phage minor capsid protein [Ruminococcus sp.]|uniref:Minor capsid protein n=1 Tax=Siphoviridae sp. ctwhn18 TaxID=2825733 RepID=A0A8S5P082_9CAUD|nr:MAG TPA: minor capsid protein [Siphoviridae sp. ctwhn18]